MSNKVLLLTTNTYDENIYEAVGTERGIVVHAVSFIRGLAGNLMGVFGGRNDLISKKIEDVYEEAMASLVENARKTYGNIDRIIALDIDLSEMTEFIICVAAGTVLRKKGNQQANVTPQHSLPTPPAAAAKGGKTRKHKNKNLRRKTRHH